MTVRRPDDFDASDEQALKDEFGTACGCDGALDDGCPLCTPEQFTLWWIQRQAEKKSRFDRPDVI